MADVIRNVIVKVKLEQIKADLQAPDMGPVKREIESVKNEVKQATESTKALSKEISSASSESQGSLLTLREESNRLGEGLSKLASAGGLYAVAMDDALPPSIRLFSTLRGGVEQISGMTTLFQQAGGVLAGPWGIAIAGATTAVSIAATTWHSWQQEITDATKDLRLQNDELDKFFEYREILQSERNANRGITRERLSLAQERGDSGEVSKIRAELLSELEAEIQKTVSTQKTIGAARDRGDIGELTGAERYLENFQRRKDILQEQIGIRRDEFRVDQKAIDEQQAVVEAQQAQIVGLQERLKKEKANLLYGSDTDYNTQVDIVKSLETRIQELDPEGTRQKLEELRQREAELQDSQNRTLDLLLDRLETVNSRIVTQQQRILKLEGKSEDVENAALSNQFTRGGSIF
ncbi:coiled-coil domain-containing protein [Aeoliella mucimassa]|uniref:Uncharacterized protein n=1 Tax=Aeoliella mucimassa TaxID=2527972 RepID=A0A518AM30_9BACT|nr:hypothetical protein [Aeoliella mucimassa]QDU55781.1 hypothetical protein Pan181_19770 [Aeoliella mucimassa]